MSDTVIMPPPASPAPPATDPQQPDVAFAGRRWPLFKLMVKNAILQLLTLGIYRFWAKTWVRRYFWSNTRIKDEPLEYTGLPSELLIGFLIVLAVLVPLGISYHFIELAMAAMPFAAQIALNVFYYVVIIALIQFGFYRMWRYRMSRTAWRGIRFGLEGSAREYVKKSFLWGLLTLATLGVAMPWTRVALMRYRISNTRYGDAPFDFEGSAKALLGPWLVFYVPLILYFGLLAASGLFDSDVMSGTGEPQINTSLAISASLVLFLIFPISIWYRVREFRFMIDSTRFSDVSFKSELETLSIILLGIGTAIVTFFVLLLIFSLIAVVVGIFAGIYHGVYDFEATLAGGEPAAAFVVGVLIILTFLMVTTVIKTVIFQRGIVFQACRTASISDSGAFNRVLQSTAAAPAHGEGLADAFDVGAI
ncbi:MAG: YjgN family protein [Rhodospirillales bacterium]|nr:YjgN family protein [Rhodospirillales bacterium]